MKIYSADQIYEAINSTIEKNNTTSNELMEFAGTQLFDWFHTRMQGAQVPIHIYCGIGNNGGSGLVLGRKLLHHGYNVHVYIVNFSDKRTKDFLINYDRIKEFKVWPRLLSSGEDFPEMDKEDIVVDAIFGIGLNRETSDWVKNLIKYINASDAYTVSLDVPSGLYPNDAPEDKEAVIESNFTLTFQAPKLSFFLPETGVYMQRWEAIDVGLDPEYLQTTNTEVQLIDTLEVLPLYIPREKYAHKGTYGHSLIIGGSFGKMGAVTLASSACLRVGTGLITAYIPECGYTILQTSLPEAMVICDEGEKNIAKIQYAIEPKSIGMGIGMGTDAVTVKALKAFLKTNTTPLIIDADALNILATNKTLLKSVPKGSILTPHPKELERLIGEWTDDFDKIEKTKAFAKKYDAVVIIKGANTITIYDNHLYINNTGNPGMATAGSGDVLTGMLTGLISQGYDALTAAIFGVYLHGKAGDIALTGLGYQALTASDIIDHIGDAYLDLFKEPEEPSAEAEENR
ncbi:NAD(P)H-hydrate dehydratase [Kordia sp. YSTF-M3]|uniref:Bifunctional NAD(P)H-hydrate repair enzyme n=1 Tax=Kordia aestuariivivens TaxID=2759037 RepID=A0ABR7Q8L7_9FLAO|nr:NAD(P)H-hydrate dehydratase [Kordia aestuariivivens]MBC8754701.1 NAD(P)H-hydrate dehydratase [Kordia aestuariivivens]